jgi:hypothetical protein
MPLKHMGGKQNLDDIPKEMGTISASKGRASKKAASNHDLRGGSNSSTCRGASLFDKVVWPDLTIHT